MDLPKTKAEPTMRADARRNREKLLECAAQAFATDGVGSSLEEIARRAGVGTGTLYRHFPTRDDLIVATYRQEVQQLEDSVEPLLAAHAPDQALRKWLDGFLQYIDTKRGMGDGLKMIMASDSDLAAAIRLQISGALSALLSAAAADGSLRGDVSADDVLLALGSVWALPESADRKHKAGRLVDLILDGLRHGASGRT